MNKDNAKEFLPLVQALADGKTIQFNDEGEWVDVEGLYTDLCEPDAYRIKPTPRKFEIWKNKNTGELRVTNFFCDLDDNPQWEHITVMEVLK